MFGTDPSKNLMKPEVQKNIDATKFVTHVLGFFLPMSAHVSVNGLAGLRAGV